VNILENRGKGGIHFIIAHNHHVVLLHVTVNPTHVLVRFPLIGRDGEEFGRHTRHFLQEIESVAEVQGLVVGVVVGVGLFDQQRPDLKILRFAWLQLGQIKVERG
jgi:hypothetical protein